MKLLVIYLKKSFLQYNFASRLKHFSVNSDIQSQHRTHDVCHRRSHTFSRNLSRMGSLQPAQWSPTPTDGSARPKIKRERGKNTHINITKSQQQHEEMSVAENQMLLLHNYVMNWLSVPQKHKRTKLSFILPKFS